MSLVHAAIVPHPPILIPEIGKKNAEQLSATRKAYGKLAETLKKEEVETIIIISPHGKIRSDVFTINLSPKFSCDFEEFGDFSRKKTWTGDVGLAYRLREQLETDCPLQLVSEEKLDHGAAIPLCLLTEELPDVKIVPVLPSDLDNSNHFNLGDMLRLYIQNSQQKIAVIASGDLSHRLTKDAPAGYSAKGKKFDKKVMDMILKKQVSELVYLDKDLVAEAGECGLKSIMILLGILSGITYQPTLLSYEYPFGVGYMVMDLEM